MAMKTPPHPGELIGDTLEELKVTISAAADGLEAVGMRGSRTIGANS